MSGRWLRMAAELKAAAARGEEMASGKQPSAPPVVSPPVASRVIVSPLVAEFEGLAMTLGDGPGAEWAVALSRMYAGPVPRWAAPKTLPTLWGNIGIVAADFLKKWGVRSAALGWDAADLFGMWA